MPNRARWTVMILALAGLGFASTSAWVHYRLLTDPAYASPCDLNATFNCTTAYLSSYGSMAGVPVALGGVIWFALVALIAGWAGPAPVAGRPASAAGAYVFALSTVGLAVVLYLGYASWVVLKTVCLLCVGTYVCVAGLFAVSGATSSVSVAQIPGRLAGDIRGVFKNPVLLVVSVLFAAAAASAVGFFPREMAVTGTQTAVTPVEPGVEAQFTDAWAQQPRIDLGIPAEGAKVVVVKFNDWLCPTCKFYHVAYQPVLEKYARSDPGAVKVVVRDFPLSSACNQGMTRVVPGHEASCTAAAAVRMARDRGKGDALVEWIFANQARLVELGLTGKEAEASAEIKARAASMAGGLDYDREYAKALAGIRQDVADGVALHVGGTPAFYVNGVSSGLLPPHLFDLAIRLELGRGSK